MAPLLENPTPLLCLESPCPMAFTYFNSLSLAICSSLSSSWCTELLPSPHIFEKYRGGCALRAGMKVGHAARKWPPWSWCG